MGDQRLDWTATTEELVMARQRTSPTQLDEDLKEDTARLKEIIHTLRNQQAKIESEA